jgi:hypothetical protein
MKITKRLLVSDFCEAFSTFLGFCCRGPPKVTTVEKFETQKYYAEQRFAPVTRPIANGKKKVAEKLEKGKEKVLHTLGVNDPRGQLGFEMPARTKPRDDIQPPICFGYKDYDRIKNPTLHCDEKRHQNVHGEVVGTFLR